MNNLIVATNNQGKLNEIREIFSDMDYTLLSLKDIGFNRKIEEDRDTFEGNAFKKAFEIMKSTGEMALADDSGLEVEALNGEPGVYSARFAGENSTDDDNNRKLIELMKDVPANQRNAVFRCVIVVVFGDGSHIKAEGVCHGQIAFQPRGKGGFGYDPYFIVDGLGKTFAELSPDEKNRVSHRGKALRKIKELLKSRV